MVSPARMARRWLLPSLLLLAPLGAAAQRPATPAGITRFRLVRIMDTQGWGQPVEVARLLVPADWQVEGGIQWVQGMTRCPQLIVQPRWRARSPDGLTGIELLPQYGWTWSDDPMQQQTLRQSAMNNLACDANPLMNPADFLARMVVPRVRQGARVLTAQPLPGVAQVEQAKADRFYAPMVQQGLLRGVRNEAGRIRVTYAVGGRPVEEWLSASVQTVAAPTANSAALMNGGVAMTASNFQVLAYDVVGVWAPQGQLDSQAKLFATILASIRKNPGYEAAVGAFLRSMGRINQQAAMDRQRIWREAQQSISNSIQQTYAENQAVQDRMAEQFGQTIRGVETYVDPTSHEKVELVGGYTDAWSNGKGEYILSDSPNFDPSVALQENWHRMQRPQH